MVPAAGVVVGGMVTAAAVAIARMVSAMAVHVAAMLLTLQMGHRCRSSAGWPILCHIRIREDVKMGLEWSA